MTTLSHKKETTLPSEHLACKLFIIFVTKTEIMYQLHNHFLSEITFQYYYTDLNLNMSYDLYDTLIANQTNKKII